MAGEQDALDQLAVQYADDELLNKPLVQSIQELAQARKLGNVNVNLAFAQMAVSHVRKKAKPVANWDERLDTSAESKGLAAFDREYAAGKGLEEQRRVAAARAAGYAEAERNFNKADRCVYRDLRNRKAAIEIFGNLKAHQPGRGVHSLRDVQIVAGLGDAYGYGNCGEMAAIAFIYLYHLGIRPLDYMALDDEFDHTFVVIGRRGNARDGTGLDWGESAVVCDLACSPKTDPGVMRVILARQGRRTSHEACPPHPRAGHPQAA